MKHLHRFEPTLPFVAPALLLLAGVSLYPLSYLIWLSLHRRLLIFGVDRWAGLENFVHLFSDPRFANALANTAYFTAVSVVLELGLGLATALLLRGPGRGRLLLRTVVLVPWAIPTVVSARMWAWLYNPDFGLLNYLLGRQINWLGSPWSALNAAVLMDVWKTFPFVALLLTAALETIPGELYAAARVDGASAWMRFRCITLPLLRPAILVVLLFRSLDAFRVFDAIYVLTGGGPADSTETVSIYAYKVLFQTLQFGYGSTVALAVFCCTAAMALVWSGALRRAWR